MKSKNFFEMSTDELEITLNNKKSELFNLRFQHATNQLTNPQVMVTCKRDIARIMTILRQRELGISAEPTTVSKRRK
ncbi:MAG: 50S ribosomal protein L29 [Clostridia bacterium]|nr:50S ribosomal protein L29 [Clostridia bacterium]